jgi:hypothetical protein
VRKSSARAPHAERPRIEQPSERRLQPHAGLALGPSEQTSAKVLLDVGRKISRRSFEAAVLRATRDWAWRCKLGPMRSDAVANIGVEVHRHWTFASVCGVAAQLCGRVHPTECSDAASVLSRSGQGLHTFLAVAWSSATGPVMSKVSSPPRCMWANRPASGVLGILVLPTSLLMA